MNRTSHEHIRENTCIFYIYETQFSRLKTKLIFASTLQTCYDGEPMGIVEDKSPSDLSLNFLFNILHDQFRAFFV